MRRACNEREPAVVAARALATFGLALLSLHCLPGDLRPEPGSLRMGVVVNKATTTGFTTDDGWRIAFDRLVTALGNVSLEDDPCNDYAIARYNRVFDFASPAWQPPAVSQKVGLVFGLGPCRIQFRMRSPSADALFGLGAQPGDVALMRLQASDDYSAGGRATLLVQGRASRAGIDKTFSWFFRRDYKVTDCEDGSAEGTVALVDFVGGSELSMDIEVRGDALFREVPNDDAPRTFDRFAAADMDGDGDITLEELAEIDAPIDRIVEEFADEIAPEIIEQVTAPEFDNATLATLVYEILVPRVAWLAGSSLCRARVNDRDH